MNSIKAYQGLTKEDLRIILSNVKATIHVGLGETREKTKGKTE